MEAAAAATKIKERKQKIKDPFAGTMQTANWAHKSVTSDGTRACYSTNKQKNRNPSLIFYIFNILIYLTYKNQLLKIS